MDPKYSKCISFRPKAFEKFSTLLEDIRKLSKFYPNYAKSIVSVHKIFENIVFVPKLQKKFVIQAQNTRKVLNFYSKYSKSMAIIIKTFDKYSIGTQNIRKYVISAAKHSKSIWFCPTDLKKLELLPQSSQLTVSDFDSKHLGSIDYICCSRKRWLPSKV